MIRNVARVTMPLLALVGLACAKPAPTAKSAEPTAVVAADPAKEVVYCNEIRECTDCPNDQFIPTECWTTQYGPARANVITLAPQGTMTSARNMLYCDTGSYALCYFSGPPDPTGRNPNTNPKLPCILDQDGSSAACTCEAFTASAGHPYFVDIHAIGNLRVYYQTVDQCGVEGEKCQNMENCGASGSGTDCGNFAKAPVCDFVANQNPANDQASLIPGADLISTFSLAMTSGYTVGSTECPNDDHLPYAGCMTAGCKFPGPKVDPPYDGNPIECACPTWKGPFQIGQTMNASNCTIPDSNGLSFVWSAAYAVEASKP